MAKLKEVPEDFSLAVASLREALREARRNEVVGETSSLLFDFLENHLNLIEEFYVLLINEQHDSAIVSVSAFDDITQRFRRVARFFTRFPGVDERSIYEKSIVTDFYYILKHHTRE